MRLFVTPASLLAGLLAAGGAHAYPDGAPPAHSGGNGQPDCGSCHFAAPAPSARSGLSLQGLPEEVEAGKPYTLTLSLRDPESRVGGFQLMLQAPEGDTGALIAGEGQAIQTHEGVAYLGHSAPAPAVDDPDNGERRIDWQIQWRPPEAPAEVRLFVAAVAADDDASPLGDNVYRLEVPLVKAD